MSAITAPIGWLQRHLKSRTQRRAFEEERLVVHATEQILGSMTTKGLSKADLAELLDTSRSNVTQILDGRRNLTLRTLARIAFELDQRIEMQLQPMVDIALDQVEISSPSLYWAPEIIPHPLNSLDTSDVQMNFLVNETSIGGEVAMPSHATGEYPLAA